MNNTPLLYCPNGHPALKCCTYRGCKSVPFMCGNEACGCHLQHNLCMCDCKLHVILNGLFYHSNADVQSLEELDKLYGEMIQFMIEERRQLLEEIGRECVKEKRPQNEEKLLNLMKENKGKQISAGLLSEVADSLRNNVSIQPSVSQMVRRVKAEKENVGGFFKKVRAEMKRVREVWNEEGAAKAKLRERIFSCGIEEIRVDTKRIAKSKTFCSEEISELHITRLETDMVREMAEDFTSLRVLKVTAPLTSETLSCFVENCNRFLKLGRFHIVNDLPQKLKERISLNKPFLQVLKIQVAQPQPVASLPKQTLSSFSMFSPVTTPRPPNMEQDINLRLHHDQSTSEKDLKEIHMKSQQ